MEQLEHYDNWFSRKYSFGLVISDFNRKIKNPNGIIESLKYSSELLITDKELTTIYTLLGYFSTETGRDFLSNLDACSLLKFNV